MRKRLTESSLEDKSYVMSLYDSIDETEKMGLTRAIQKCLDENPDLKKRLKFSAKVSGYLLIVLIVALKIGAKEMLAIPALGALGLSMDSKLWGNLKNCIREKMGKTPSTETPKIQESKMKKTIRLTESELVELVQRIISEDEMSGSDMPFAPKKTVQDIINTKRFDQLREGVMVSVKNNKLTMEPGGSESSERYVIDLNPKSQRDVVEQQAKVKVVNGKLLIKLMSGEKIVLDPSLKVLNFSI
jgi:hypothetical protein